MYFDIKKLEDTVKPKIESARTHLKTGKEYIEELSIPSDFLYYTSLINMPESISEIDGEIKNIETWLDTAIEDLKKVELDNKALIEGMQMPEDLTKSPQEKNELVWETIWEGVQAVGASIGNVVVSLVEGLGEAAEAIVDTATTVATGVASIFTGMYDLITGDSVTERMWNGTMAFVAEEHFENFFKKFYSENSVGQWLDEHAFGGFTSDGIVTSIASGIGYVGGIALATVLTGGVAGVTISPAIVAGTAGIGRSLQNTWGQMRDSSWEGIQEKYNRGEISEGDMITYNWLRNLSDIEWEQNKEILKRDGATEEAIEQMEQIREIPEDWTNAENILKGAGYGVLEGLWESAQWYVGGKLNNSKFTGSIFKDALIRIGVDTGFNAIDTPYRSGLDNIVFGRNFEEAFYSRGGWQSILADAGIGLIGSARGELFDSTKINKKIENAREIFYKLADEIDLKHEIVYVDGKNPTKIYIGNKKIDDVFERIKVYKNIKEFKKVTEEIWGEDNGVLGFYSHRDQMIHFPPNANLGTIVHEVNHALGNVSQPYAGATRGINEAFTESIAKRLTSPEFETEYDFNVRELDKLMEAFAKKYNIENPIMKIYFKPDEQVLFKYKIDDIAGSGYYEKIANLMDIADGCGTITDRNDVSQAQHRLKFLIDQFCNLCEKTN